MVNTVVTFSNDRTASISTPPITKTTRLNSTSIEKVYLILGIFFVSIIIIPNIFALATEQEDFVYHILFLVHSGFLCLFLLSTSVFQSLGDGFTTISTLVLLLVYKSIHYLIRHRYCQDEIRRDFLFSTIQFCLIFILVIIFILWTFVLIRKRHIEEKKFGSTRRLTIDTKQKHLFYSLLNLNVMLTISSLIVYLRTKENFHREEILLLSIGVPFAFLWYILAISMSKFRNCFTISFFYFASILQPFYLFHLASRTIGNWRSVETTDDLAEHLPLFLICFICICVQSIVHFISIFTACWLISETDRMLIDLRWMFNRL